MNAVAERVAREHRAAEVLTSGYVGCLCGVGPLSLLSHAAHVAHHATVAAIEFEAERVNDRLAGTDARAWLLARAMYLDLEHNREEHP